MISTRESDRANRFCRYGQHILLGLASLKIVADSYLVPSRFVFESPNFEVKKAALRKFTSQQKAPYFKEKCIDSFHHNFLCSKKGLIRVESYRIVESYSL